MTLCLRLRNDLDGNNNLLEMMLSFQNDDFLFAIYQKINATQGYDKQRQIDATDVTAIDNKTLPRQWVPVLQIRLTFLVPILDEEKKII